MVLLSFIPSVTRSRYTDAKVARGLGGSRKVWRQAVSGRIFLKQVERIQPENLAAACHALKRHPATETSD